LRVSEMMAEDWVLLFGLDMINPVSVLIQRVIYSFEEERVDFGSENFEWKA